MTTLTDLTLEYLIENFSCDVYNGIEYATSKYPKYLKTPTKPIISNNPTSDEVFAYAHKLKEYEDLIVIYDEQKNNRLEKIDEINDIVEEFIKEAAYLKSVPEKYRDNVYSKAYSDGHSGGFYEVYQKLCNLCEIFE